MVSRAATGFSVGTSGLRGLVVPITYPPPFDNTRAEVLISSRTCSGVPCGRLTRVPIPPSKVILSNEFANSKIADHTKGFQYLCTIGLVVRA